MLIKELQLLKKSNILDQLNEAVYLTNEESKIHLEEVPVLVKENGSNLVDYCYLERISKLNGCSIFEAANLIKERNDIDNIKISIDEGDAIAIQDDFDSNIMVVKPLSEDTYDYLWTEILCESLIEIEIPAQDFCDMVLSEDRESEEVLRKRRQDKIDSKYNDAIDQINTSRDYNDMYTSKMEQRDRDNAENERKSETELLNKKMSRLRNIRKIRDTRRKEEGQPESGILEKPRDSFIKRIDNQNNKRNSSKSSGEKDTNNNISSQKPTQVSDRTKHLITNNKIQKEYGLKDSHKGKGLMSKNSLSDTVVNPHNNEEAKKRVDNLVNKKDNNTSSLKYGAAVVGGAALAGAGYLAYKQYKNQPKSVIGKRIAALRKIYAKFMQRAQSSKDSGIAAKLKKVAAHILQVIDKLLGFLQNKAG